MQASHLIRQLCKALRWLLLLVLCYEVLEARAVDDGLEQSVALVPPAPESHGLVLVGQKLKVVCMSCHATRGKAPSHRHGRGSVGGDRSEGSQSERERAKERVTVRERVAVRERERESESESERARE